MTSLLADFATRHRGIFVTVFVLPVSLLFDVWFRLRAWAVIFFFSAPKLHEKRVAFVQEQVRRHHETKDKRRMVTARGGWQSITPGFRDYKSKAYQVQIDLYDVLEINEEEMWVSVEPLVSMGQLSHYLIPKGYTIPVIPEMDDLTVGGLLNGVGIETSSHKYGLFNDTVIEADLVLANGDLVTCSPTQNRDLWDALPWSYGTLGFLVACKIRIIPCARYVRVEYRPCFSQHQGATLFQKLSESTNPPDFVEALAYSANEMVVMPANFASEEDRIKEGGVVNSISLWYKPWFFKHVQSMLQSEQPRVEYLPLRDYYHRHTKAIFWELEEIIPFGNNPLFRFLLGWAVPPKVSFLKLTQTEQIRKLYETQHVIQDMLVPFSEFKNALDIFDKMYEVYPLWLCPFALMDRSDKKAEHAGFLRRPKKPLKGRNYEMFVDLGAYGVPAACKRKEPFNIVAVSRAVEAYVASVDGYQMLYATSYQTRPEFEAMFDHSKYFEVKKKVDPNNAFPQIFDKVCKAGASAWGAQGGAQVKATTGKGRARSKSR